MNSKMPQLRPSAIRILLIFLCIVLSLMLIFLKFVWVEPLRSEQQRNDSKITELKEQQDKQDELIEQIKSYRDGLYALSVILEARKNILSGNDPEKPYLVYDQGLVLDYLSTLVPEDARVGKYQINEKGWVTMPIESIDYASLGRVLKRFKNEKDEAFSEVLVPSSVQRSIQQDDESEGVVSSRYSLILQAKLKPDFWKAVNSYSDVDSSAYYAQALQDFTERGLIKGFSDGTFKPEKTVNQNEFLTLLLRWIRSQDRLSEEEVGYYLGLLQTEPVDAYLMISNELNLPKLDDKDVAEKGISHKEALKIILSFNTFELNSNEEQGQEAYESIPLANIDHDEELIKNIQEANHLGMLDYLNEDFEPDEKTTRAELVYWLWKLNLDPN